MTKHVYIASLFLGLALSGNTYAQSASQPSARVVQGVVFNDKNANGIFDKGESGLKQTLISNGRDVIKTDKKGRFELLAAVGQSVFPILPTGYKLSTNKTMIGNANFFYLDPSLSLSDTLFINFAVEAEKQSNSFSIGAIGDVQVDNEEELSFAARSIMKELSQRKDLAFNIMLGDLVNDKMSLIPSFKNLLQQVPTKSWTLVGNHDRNTDRNEFINDVFNRNFGADTYAFNYGNVHFIVLNNVFATGQRSYEGRISEDQLEFLKRDLAYVSPETTVVLSQHIPMAHTRNKKEVLALMEDFKKVLFLSGHTHTVNRYFFGSSQFHELGAGATCGNWWRGEKNAGGIPEALMQCGTPRGYFVVNFDNGDYDFKFKGVDIDQHRQMSLQVDSNKFLANIYGASDSTEVLIQIDSSNWLKMNKVRTVDTYVEQVISKNKEKIYPTKGNTRNPLGSRASSHIWEVKIPDYMVKSLQRIRIQAKDPYGFSVSENFIINR